MSSLLKPFAFIKSGLKRQPDAAGWFALMRSPDVSGAEHAAFQKWLRADPRHQAEYNKVQAFWADAGAVASEFPKAADVHILNSGAKVKGEAGNNGHLGDFLTNPARKWGAGGLAAAIVVLMLVTAHSLQDGKVYATDKGQVISGVLEDGSVLYLNTQSRIVVDIEKDVRALALNSGEAFFEVAHEKERPFIVKTKDGSIRAVGTAFNVHTRDQDTVVTVMEGVVQIMPHLAGGLGVEPRLVHAGEKVTFSASSYAGNIEKSNTREVVAWRARKLVFNDTAFADVIEEFNRYLSVELRIKDSELDHMRLSGSFNATDLSSLLEILDEGFSVKAVTSGKRIDLYTQESIASR